jgi:uncharacterized protein (DUF2141 family)
MKSVCSLLLLTLAACGGTPAASNDETIPLAKGTATLTATVTKFKAGKGLFYCGLFTPEAASAFPGASPVIGGNLTAAVTGETMTCTFTNLAAGDYALSASQDENSNGKIDLSVFGAPIEGYGASRNNLPATSAPTFADNMVTVADGATVSLDIVLKN